MTTITIGITTFEARFEEFFKPLIESIKRFEPDVEVIVAVNGEHGLPFDNDYRSKMCSFCGVKKNIYPIFFPEFRGLAKLWNTILIHSTNDHVLMLNDDVSIENPCFLKRIQLCIEENQQWTFIINGTWSHFVANCQEIDDIGYFDERFLGIGKEDWDMEAMYQLRYGFPIRSFDIVGMKDLCGQTCRQKPANIICNETGKYSRFNDTIVQEKYKTDIGGISCKLGSSIVMREDYQKQYPHERFYKDRRSEL